jgi:putative oxidoreductase
MATTTSRWAGWAPWLQSVLRIIAAFVFMQFGTAKLFVFPGPLMPGMGPVPAFTLPWFAGVLETFGGALVLVGLFTRPVALVLSGEMAVAYFLAHAPKGFWAVLNEGTPAVLFCFIWLYFAAAGAGPLSLDAAFGRDPKGSTLS